MPFRLPCLCRGMASTSRLSFQTAFPSSTRRPTALPGAEGGIFSTTETISLESLISFEGLFWGSGTAELQRVERSKRQDTDAFNPINWLADCSQWQCWWTVGVDGGEWQTQPSAASQTANDQQIKDCYLNRQQCLLLLSSKQWQQCCASVQCCFFVSINVEMYCGWLGECTKMFCSSVICSQTPLSTPTLTLHSNIRRCICELPKSKKRENSWLVFMEEAIKRV